MDRYDLGPLSLIAVLGAVLVGLSFVPTAHDHTMVLSWLMRLKG